MTTSAAEDLDQLHCALLHLIAGAQDPITTAELRVRAHQLLADDAAPLVNETVYRALRTLLRRGQVRHHRSPGRHVRWTLTPTGTHTVERLRTAARHPEDLRQ